ncbi:MAG: triphosphoribosyl-dephospho-CoA synthase, partial [Nitrososphaerota archaeon]
MKAKLTEIADEIMLCAQLAAALEVSGYPKPGNVHRTADFLETRFEDFLASSVAIGPPIRMLAWRALRASRGQLGLNQLRVGETVKECVTASVRWQKGGNTHLGSILLFAPLTAAAGLCGSLETINSINLRENIERVINASTEDDALEIFSVISETTPRTLGRLKKDVHKDILNQSIRNYRRKTDMTLLEAMQHASR